MPPKSEAVLRYEVIDRCLTNIYKRYPSMEDLQYKCERELKRSYTAHTIQRDISAMKFDEKLGYMAPIKFSKQNNGYYYADPNYTIRTFGINDKEIEAIELAAGVLQHFKGIKVNDTYNHAVDKLFSALDIKKSSKEESLEHAIQPEESMYMRGMEHFETLINSIKKRIPVSFIHYSYERKFFKTIIAHPYLLKESNKRWYLVGYSEEHQEIRYFGLDRIYDPILIDKAFVLNEKTDLRNLFNNKIGINKIRAAKKNNRSLTEDEIDSEKLEDIRIWVSKEMANYIKSMPLHSSQVIREKEEGDLVIDLKLVPTTELVSLILSYGQNMCVMRPVWLKIQIINELQHLFEQYKQILF
jgi:predicted DNA-binding transcriptional regulator YafY